MNSNPSSLKIDRDTEVNLSSRKTALSFLFQERHRLNLSEYDFEQLSGVSWDALYRWRSGKREPTMGNLVAAAETLGFEIILRRKTP